MRLSTEAIPSMLFIAVTQVIDLDIKMLNNYCFKKRPIQASLIWIWMKVFE